MTRALVRKIAKEFRGLFIRKHLREISFTLGTVSFGDCLKLVTFLLFHRQRVVEGEYIRQFEEEFSRYVGVSHAFSFGAGRMAFYAILKAMGVKEGDEVILPGYTCVVVPNAVVYCGARPVYLDIDVKTLTMDVRKVKEKLTDRTKVILVQPMFQACPDMEAISSLAREHGVKVVEDCAHTLGATYRGRKLGTFGDAAFFTLEQSKIFTTWMGGVAVTSDPELADRLRHFQSDTLFPDARAVRRTMWQLISCYFFLHPAFCFVGKYFMWFFSRVAGFMPTIQPEEMSAIRPEGYPTRLSNIQARLALRQLLRIEANLRRRREIAASYDVALRGLGLTVAEQKAYLPAYIRYALLTRDRERLKELFSKNQVELGEWYNSVVHPRGSSLEAVCYEEGSCPVAEFAAEHCVNLPTHPKVSHGDVRRIVRLLQQNADLLLDPHKEPVDV